MCCPFSGAGGRRPGRVLTSTIAPRRFYCTREYHWPWLLGQDTTRDGTGPLRDPGDAAVPADLGRRRARAAGVWPPLGHQHHARRHELKPGEGEPGEVVAVAQLGGQPG